MQKCTMNESSQVFHSNHFLLDHSGVGTDTVRIKDSTYRVSRIEELAKQIKGGRPRKEKIFDIFKDESNYPGAICRAQKQPSSITVVSPHQSDACVSVSLSKSCLLLFNLSETSPSLNLRFFPLSASCSSVLDWSISGFSSAS